MDVINVNVSTMFPKLEKMERATVRYYAPSFGVVNLLAMGDETKYFPEEFLKDIGWSHLNAKEIKSIFMRCDMDLDGDVLDGWYIDIMHHIFVKNTFEVVEK